MRTEDCLTVSRNLKERGGHKSPHRVPKTAKQRAFNSITANELATRQRYSIKQAPASVIPIFYLWRRYLHPFLDFFDGTTDVKFRLTNWKHAHMHAHAHIRARARSLPSLWRVGANVWKFGDSGKTCSSRSSVPTGSQYDWNKKGLLPFLSGYFYQSPCALALLSSNRPIDLWDGILTNQTLKRLSIAHWVLHTIELVYRYTTGQHVGTWSCNTGPFKFQKQQCQRIYLGAAEFYSHTFFWPHFYFSQFSPCLPEMTDRP